MTIGTRLTLSFTFAVSVTALLGFFAHTRMTAIEKTWRR